jgi:hypothetical protein
MRTGIAVSFDVLNERWAQNNHHQSLSDLARRGGVIAGEALAIAERRSWRVMDEEQALRDLVTLAFLKSHHGGV